MTRQTMFRRHADLVDRMATALGLDLEEAAMAGQIGMDTIGDAVLACTGCTHPDGCNRWLEMQTGKADATPTICRNSALFERLKAGKSV